VKSVLLLSWLLTGGAGYFGYTLYQQSLADARKSAQALADANASNADLSTKLSGLTQQISTLTSRLAEEREKARTPIPAPASVTVPASEVSVAPQITALLPSTITTIYGKTYTDCVLSRQTPDGISFTHSMGVAKVLFTDLDPSLAAKFGYDAAAARKYEQDEGAREAQSDALRIATVNAQKSFVPVDTVASPPDPGEQAAKQSQIAALQQQITGLQSSAQRLDDQEVAEFNSPENIYYNSEGQQEHHRTMGHSQQADDDRNRAAALQVQISNLQSSP
jgi:hypothetical protein